VIAGWGRLAEVATEATGVPAGVDPGRPSPARIYDYYLGGTHNFAADREVADRVIAAMPLIPAIMRANRAFLGRAVRAVTAAGVDQFIDLGAGIPTQGPLHQLARRSRPAARVVYVDVDPAAVIHSREILGNDPHTVVVQADLHAADSILDHPAVRALLDFTRPVCLVMLAVLHFAPDSPALRTALRRYHDTLPTGSYVIVSHATAETRPAETGKVSALYTRTSAPLVLRDRDQLAGLLTGWTIVEPGLVDGPCWRPDPDDPPVTDPGSYASLVAVARKD
jgi:O-methyltransferase involved in polyketide biosynthesis